jgi:hypothetical protein
MKERNVKMFDYWQMPVIPGWKKTQQILPTVV